MSRTITFKGAPLTLVGRTVKTGISAPNFRVSSQELKEITLDDFRGKVKIITTFPSLDTSVCDLQVKEFNKRATQLSLDLVVIGISKDLPFAQKRFCSKHAITKVVLASDYKSSSFGINYGLLIKELNLLARAVLIIDRFDTLRYVKIVDELTLAPDYDDALRAAAEIVSAPAAASGKNAPLNCMACEGKIFALSAERIAVLRKDVPLWEIAEGKKLIREFVFKNFADAKYFLDLLSIIAEEQGHHPTLTLMYTKVRVTLSTHAASGLTDNDFLMARIIDEVEVSV